MGRASEFWQQMWGDAHSIRGDALLVVYSCGKVLLSVKTEREHFWRGRGIPPLLVVYRMTLCMFCMEPFEDQEQKVR